MRNDRVFSIGDVGIIPNLEIKGSLKVQKAIRSIARYGKITFSKEEIFKSSYYTIHFFKPTKALLDLYNLGNEVLILCCADGMGDFKSRTKDFIDYILTTRAEYKNRLDKITCFLIDDNRDIEGIVKQDRKDNPDSRLIIPFSYEELQVEINESAFQNRMRTFLYERDLFGIASPLNSDAYFFGNDRSNLISELYGKYKQGEQGGLFGLRRIGKTSVLNLLRIRIMQGRGAAVYFDCSRYHHKRWNQFLREIVNRVVREYSAESTGDDDRISLGEVCVSDDDNRYNPENASNSFDEDMRKLYKALGNVRILLIFDEIENVSYTTSPSKHWNSGTDALYFWQTLRAIIQTDNSIFSFVITGVNPKCVEISKISEYDNPIFGMLRPHYISLFNLADVKNMVAGIGGHLGLSFDEEIFTKLVDDFGGHPFLIRQVCSKINNGLLEKNELRPYVVTKFFYEKQAKDYRIEMAGAIEQILGVLDTYYPREYELLKTLALDGRNSFKKEIRNGDATISHLLGYCLIQKDDEDYFIRIKSIEDYLKNKYENEIVFDSQKEKRARLNSRREDIEMKLREIVYHNVTRKYGKRAKNRMVDILGASMDSSQLGRINGKLFKPALEELYFNQLKALIFADWGDYQIYFNEKKKFEQFFDLVNECRNVGAHSRSLDEEDEAIYNVALKHFEKALSFE